MYTRQCAHQGKPPLETYLQFGEISFLLGKGGQLEEIRDNIPQIATVGKVTLLGVHTGKPLIASEYSGMLTEVK